MTDRLKLPWVFRDSPKDPFPVRCFAESYEAESRSYGDYGGIYDSDLTPVAGCNEYMVFRDEKMARFIVNAVNALQQIKEELLHDVSNGAVALKIAQDVLGEL